MSKGYKRSIYLDFDYSSIKQGVPDVERALNELDANFKAQAAQATNLGKAHDKLELSLDRAKQAMTLYQKKVEILTEELHQLENAEVRDEKAISDKRIVLDKARKATEDAAAEVKKFEKALKDQNVALGLSKTQLTAFADKAMQIGKSLTTYVTLPIMAVGAGAVKMASDLQENINKVDQVFDKNAETIKEWANDSLTKMGMARSTAYDMAALFGDMGSGMGLESEQIVEYSTSLTQLAADLASFKNKKLEVAQTALAGIYTGETEALKGLGIIMTQANLQQFAYAEGIRKKVSEMTQAELVQLRYNYVMAQTANAHGDFERTGGNAANQVRVFQESLKELGAAFGETILPAFTEIVRAANTLLKEIAALPQPIKEVIVGILAVAAAAGPVILAIGTVAKTIVAVHSAQMLLSGGMPALIAALTGTATASTAAATATATAGVSATAAAAGFLPLMATAVAVSAAITAVVYAIIKLVDWYKKWRDESEKMKYTEIPDPKALGQKYTHSKLTGFAIGTHYAAAGRARVHEYGSEIIDLPNGSRVYTAEQSRQMMSSRAANDTLSAKLLSELIGKVDKLTNTVAHLPDRQLLLSRE